MPDMQSVRYLARPLEGVELADTLYLPEKVQVTGDVVIVAKHLVFEGRDVLIKGNHNISIFPAEEVTVMGDTLPRRLYKKDGKQRIMVEVPDTRPAHRTGNITIDTSGIGYKDWLESIGGEGRLNKVMKALYNPDKSVREAALLEFESLRLGRKVGPGDIGRRNALRVDALSAMVSDGSTKEDDDDCPPHSLHIGRYCSIDFSEALARPTRSGRGTCLLSALPLRVQHRISLYPCYPLLCIYVCGHGGFLCCLGGCPKAQPDLGKAGSGRSCLRSRTRTGQR